MVVGALRVVQEAQRDPAGEPLPVCEAGALLEVVAVREAVGGRDIAFAEGAPRSPVAQPPPALGPAYHGAGPVDQLDHALGPATPLAPARPFVEQSGVVLQRGRKAADGMVDAGPVEGQSETCLGQLRIAAAKAARLAPGRSRRAALKEGLKAGHLVVAPQQVAITVEEGALLATREAARHPGLAQEPRCRHLLTVGPKRLGQPQGTVHGTGAFFAEPCQQLSGHETVGQAFLRAAPDIAQPRPPGMGVEEGRELSEIAVALGPRQLQPCEELTQ